MTEPAIRQRQAVDLDEFERRLRAVAPTSKPTEDPLAELARLVGQDDPFRQVFAEPMRTESARSERARIEPARAEPPRILRREPPPLNAVPDTRPAAPGFAELRAPSGVPERAEIPQDPYWERHRAPEAADPGRGRELADDLYGAPKAPDDEQWLGEDGQLPPPPEEARPPRRSRRGVYALSGAAAVALVTVGVLYLFKGTAVMGTSEPPTIRAALGPAKVAPAGTSPDIADQDATVLDRNTADGTQQTQVVTREEQPVDLAQATNMPAPRSDDAAASPTPPLEPKRVKTVTVRPDGTIVSEDGSSQSRSIAPIAMQAPTLASAPNPVNLPPATKAPDNAAAAAAPVAKAATPKTTVRIATTPKAATAAGSNLTAGQPAKPRPAAKAVAPPTPAADTVEADATPPQATDTMPTGATGPTNTAASGGAAGFAVQLAAPASEQEARDLATRLQKKFASELAGYHPTIHRADAAGKQVYRVRVGNLSREDAVSLCEKLKAGGGACFIAKN